jgi:OOP family OmpA-OmpF porin
MKHVFAILALCFLASVTHAQVLKRLGDRAKQKIEQKAGDKVDKTIDNATDGKQKQETETAEGEVKVKTEDGETKVKTESKGPGLKAYSKFDFVPGEKILYAEDFSQDAIGEFPLKWNTNGSGEVVTIEGLPGKWLQLNEATRYESPYKTKLPDNFTIEYDLLVEFKDDQNVPDVHTIIYREIDKNRHAGAFFKVMPNGGNSQVPDAVGYHSQNVQGYTDLTGKYYYVNHFNEVNHTLKPVHVAIWVQKQRFRAWVNHEKVYDLPQGIPADALPDRIAFELTGYGGPRENYNFYMTNLKVAAAMPDTRSKLITEGKWSTSGILFNTNSDKIRPESYGVLKEIATTLKENPGVKVKIIGHTDSDGDDAANLDLSKRRAASVRIVLTTELGIDGTRFETDGMGESKPVADNKTSEGKAQNRRVEFIKL